MTTTETRLTDEKTGGQKGTKDARFDLIPPVAVQIVVMDCPAQAELEESFHRYASGGNAHQLIPIARFCMAALGGDWEAELARVFGFGAKKYADRNWERGYPWSWSYGAMRRHWALHMRGQLLDEETGLFHIAHVLWHCLVLIEFERRGIGTDDRVTV